MTTKKYLKTSSVTSDIISESTLETARRWNWKGSNLKWQVIRDVYYALC